MDLEIAGKRALVLASSRGLGLGIAERLAGEGADVIICGRSEDRLAAAAEQITARGKGKATPCGGRSCRSGRRRSTGIGGARAFRQSSTSWSTTPAARRPAR